MTATALSATDTHATMFRAGSELQAIWDRRRRSINAVHAFVYGEAGVVTQAEGYRSIAANENAEPIAPVTMTPALWQRCGHIPNGSPHMTRVGFCKCKQCDLCKHFQAIEAFRSDVWQRFHASGPRPEFWSPESALSELDRHKRERTHAAIKSVGGAVEDVGAAGMFTSRAAHERIGSAFAQAERNADVIICLRAVAPRIAPDLPAERVVAALMLRVVGHEQIVKVRGIAHRKWVSATPRQIAEDCGFTLLRTQELLAEGIDELRVEMAARDMVPPPRVRKKKSNTVDLGPRIAERRRELEMRR